MLFAARLLRPLHRVTSVEQFELDLEVNEVSSGVCVCDSKQCSVQLCMQLSGIVPQLFSSAFLHSSSSSEGSEPMAFLTRTSSAIINTH